MIVTRPEATTTIAAFGLVTALAPRRPWRSTIAELASVPGVGPAKLERYGSDVLEALEAA